MVNYFKRLQGIYDKEVRIHCDKNRQKILNCFNVYKGDEHICAEEILLFQACVENYNKKFKEKYSNTTSFKIS